MKLKHSDMAFPVFQSGSAIYYLYRPAALDSIVETAMRRKMRLVYQGFAF